MFECRHDGPELVTRRVATPEEDAQLDRATALTVDRLRARGLETTIVAQRLNRRKIDIIPLAAWADPPKARIVDLLNATEARLRAAGIASVAEVVAIAQEASTDASLADARITSDAKYVEIGLTDKADAARWAFADLWAHGIAPSDVIVVGDEFGLLGGVPGSDSLMLVPESQGCLAVTVGAEPFGPPPGVLPLPGGPDKLLEVLADQLGRRQRGQPPDPTPESSWRVAIEGLDEGHEPARSTMLTLADGRIGTTSQPLGSTRVTGETRMAGFYEGEGPEEHLCTAPSWNQLGIPLDGSGRLAEFLTSIPAFSSNTWSTTARRCRSWSSARWRSPAPQWGGRLGVTRFSTRSIQRRPKPRSSRHETASWPCTSVTNGATAIPLSWSASRYMPAGI